MKAAVPRKPASKDAVLELRDYQIQGAAWLAYNYLEKRSCVLADEMGLGKTVQTVTFLRMVKDTCYNARDPALVVAPLSTLEHWQREFATWTDLDVAVYYGGMEDRQTARNDDIFVKKSKNSLDVDVVITTYEQLLLDDSKKLAEAKYSVIVVDEAHRLKNPNSRFYKTLNGDASAHLKKTHWAARQKVLLTGTPLQNDVKELWAILSFCDDDEFPDCDDFVDQYQGCCSEVTTTTAADDDDEKDDDKILTSLLERMRPYVLRREKAHVEKAVPPKSEIVVDVALAKTQKRCYRALYEKNVAMLAGQVAKDGPSLTNLAMELRKCCNHPFLLKGVEEHADLFEKKLHHDQHDADKLVDACGKLQFLDKLLPKLQNQSSKVLIFSQFTMMLNVLEDYLDGRAYKFGRIDGGVTGRDRQREIDTFCDSASEKFVMLLSTRAGGVGINLVAADTVIIYDSDWNPQNDVQAMARCHRIGQTKPVTVYRLLTSGTYEAHMYDVATAKLDLDRAVLDGMAGKKGATKKTREFQEQLLKKAATAVSFADDVKPAAEEAAPAEDMMEQTLDDILATRSRKVVLRTGEGGGALESLSTATFVNKKVDDVDVDLDDPDFWHKTLGHALEEHKKMVSAQAKDKSRAAKTKISYNEDGAFLSPEKSERMSDYEGDDDDDEEDSDGSDDEEEDGKKRDMSQQQRKKQRLKEERELREAEERLKKWKKSHLNALKQQLQKRGVGHSGTGFIAGSKELEARAKLSSADDVKRAARTVVLSHARACVEVLAKTRKRETARYFYEEAKDKTDRSYLVEAARRTLRRNKAVFVAADEEARSSLETTFSEDPKRTDDSSDSDDVDDDVLKADDEQRTYRAALALVDWRVPEGNLQEICFAGNLADLQSDDDIKPTQSFLDKWHQQEVIHIVVERINRVDYKDRRSESAQKKKKMSNEAKLFEALGDNDPPTDAKPSHWWRARHDCALLKFADHHGAAMNEKMRLDFFQTFSTIMPDDVKEALDFIQEQKVKKAAPLPTAPPPPPATNNNENLLQTNMWLAPQAGAIQPLAKKPPPRLPSKEELKKRLTSLVLTVVSISPRDSIFVRGKRRKPKLYTHVKPLLPSPVSKKAKPSPICIDVDAEPANYPVDDDVIILDGPPPEMKQQPITNYFLKDRGDPDVVLLQHRPLPTVPPPIPVPVLPPPFPPPLP